MVDIEKREQFDKFIQSDKAVCALFTADWCPDCQVLKPLMPELETEFTDRYDFITVNRDPFLDLCQELNIFGIPSFVLFSKGEETGRFVSKARKTREEIEVFLRKTESL